MKPSVLPNDPAEIYESALAYFRARGGVIFLSGGRFWESFPMPQQSLATFLADHGVSVLWYDGVGWRPYHPVFEKTASLNVQPLFQLPGMRFSPVRKLNFRLQLKWIRRQMEARGGHPVVWVEGGIDEELAEVLPYIDVFSVFDDPHVHRPEGNLAVKARMIQTQNSFAFECYSPIFKNKTHRMTPPMAFPAGAVSESRPEALAPLPNRLMGYIGSFHSGRFDFVMFEKFVGAFPDWGFLILGRSDAEGDRWANEMAEKYSNFLRLPVVPRSQTVAYWKCLSLSLLFYKDAPHQHGAFSTKAIESFHYGVPCLGTNTHITEDLADTVPLSNDFEALKENVSRLDDLKRRQLAMYESKWKLETSPGEHLQRTADYLARKARQA